MSQFTLYAKPVGRKLDFHGAMRPELAAEYFDAFVQSVRKAYVPERVNTGKFGHQMQVELINDGPVTIEFCTDGLELPKSAETKLKERQARAAAAAAEAATSESRLASSSELQTVSSATPSQ